MWARALVTRLAAAVPRAPVTALVPAASRVRVTGWPRLTVRPRIARLTPAIPRAPRRRGSAAHVCDLMISPSLATALLAVDFTVPFDSPVASAISASDKPP